MVICKCDGCNKEEPAVFLGNNNWTKPTGWYQRDVSALRHTYTVDDEGNFKAPTVIVICSLACAKLVVEKFKKYLTL